MSTWADIYPPFGVAISCGDVDLRALTPNDVPALLDLAVEGVAHPGRPYPFVSNWALLEPHLLRRNSAQFYFSQWASLNPSAWTLLMVVRHRGEIVGCQDLMTQDFPVRRVAHTGSWLGLKHQGKGIGTTMRQAACAFAFDALGADECRTEAYADNPASQRVSEKVGYERFDACPVNRLGERAVEMRFRLTPERLNRPEQPVSFHGVGPFREFIGLD
ncbi:MAG: GNAT family protein [Arachnia sp.]